MSDKVQRPDIEGIRADWDAVRGGTLTTANKLLAWERFEQGFPQLLAYIEELEKELDHYRDAFSEERSLRLYLESELFREQEAGTEQEETE